MNNVPIREYVEDAVAQFTEHYGLNPDTIHVSAAMERVLHRWASKTLNAPLFDLKGATFLGLEVLRSTKRTPHVEFWLSLTQGGQVYSMQLRLEPEEVGAKKLILPGSSQLG